MTELFTIKTLGNPGWSCDVCGKNEVEGFKPATHFVAIRHVMVMHVCKQHLVEFSGILQAYTEGLKENW